MAVTLASATACSSRDSDAGTGGVEGSGGSGGSAGGGSQNPLQWVYDPTAWELLPAEPGFWDDPCAISEAKSGRIGFPALSWETCGPGCEKADLLQGYDPKVWDPILSTVRSSSGAPSAYLQVTNLLPARPPGAKLLSLRRIIDLASGRTVVATKVERFKVSHYSLCSISGGFPSASILDAYRSNEDQSESVTMTGWFDFLNSKMKWYPQLPLSAESNLCERFTTDGNGKMFYACYTKIRGNIQPNTADIVDLATMDDDHMAVVGTGEGELAIWSEYRLSLPPPETTSRIRGWRNDGEGIRTIVPDMPGTVCGLGLDGSEIAGFSVDEVNPYGCYGPQANPRLWVASRTDPQKPISTGPPLTSGQLYASNFQLSSSKHWIALHFSSKAPDGTNRNTLALVRKADWTTRWYTPPKGMLIHSRTLDDSSLYVVLTPELARDYRSVSEVMRFDLSHFDEFTSQTYPYHLE